MLMQLPYTMDWIDSYLVCGIKLVKNSEQRWGVQILVFDTKSIDTFAALTFQTFEEAIRVRDEIASAVNHYQALEDAEAEQFIQASSH